MSDRTPEFDDYVQRAKSADILDVAKRAGAQIKKAGANEWMGPCPSCGGTDRFSINTREQIYNCRGSASNRGKDGGDVIAMVQHIQNLKFVDALVFITGESPPGRDEGPVRPVDDSFARERREEQRDRKIEIQTAEQREFDENCRKSEILWDAGEPIAGTIAQQYLERRGLRPSGLMLEDLRFVPDLPYYGYANKDTKELSDLGSFPALIAAIRSSDMTLQGVHRIYIDPKTHGKLLPPGDRTRNKAKKAFGNVMGGCVWLGPTWAPFVAIAEGIETAIAYWQLGYSGDCTVAAAVSLGNLSGKATGSLPHPTLPKRTVPNGIPDMEGPGVRLPPNITEVLVIGDGDSEKVATRHAVLTAVQRFTNEGRKSYALFAPDGEDFNDVLLSLPSEVAA